MRSSVTVVPADFRLNAASGGALDHDLRWFHPHSTSEDCPREVVRYMKPPRPARTEDAIYAFVYDILRQDSRHYPKEACISCLGSSSMLSYDGFIAIPSEKLPWQQLICPICHKVEIGHRCSDFGYPEFLVNGRWLRVQGPRNHDAWVAVSKEWRSML